MVPSTGHLAKPKLLKGLQISSFKPEVTTIINILHLNTHKKIRNWDRTTTESALSTKNFFTAARIYCSVFAKASLSVHSTCH
jgi:hypothetical protein